MAKVNKNDNFVTKGQLYLDSESDMERLVTLLTRNNYTVKVKQVAAIDAFCTEFEISFNRKEYG